MGSQRIDPAELDRTRVYAAAAEVVTWKGHRALRLQDGLALIEGVWLEDGAIEMDLSTDGACSAGIAFRAADADNFELAYVRPHCTGQPDPLQCDLVLNGTNTWQVFDGPRYQAPAQIPADGWLTLRTDVVGGSAVISAGQQDPLVIEQLAHGMPARPPSRSDGASSSPFPPKTAPRSRSRPTSERPRVSRS